MSKKIPQPTSLPRERAFLVGVDLYQQKTFLPLEDSLNELALLSDTSGLEVVGELTQKLDRPNVKTYIGPGKGDELKHLVEETLSQVVIFDDELSPRHQRELQEELGRNVRVLVDTRFDGRVWIFPADLRHCRDERWQEEAGTLELVELESATSYAVPFKPDYQIHVERDPERGEMVYRGSSRFDSFEERHPRNTGVITPWSVRTVDYDRLLDLFARGAYGIDSRLVATGTVGGDEVGLYAIGGEWPRRLWYQGDKMIRFCGQEPFGTYIETVLEIYADRAVGEVGLNRPCAELFE